MIKLEEAPFKYKAFFTLAIYTGLRNGELLGLEWKDIDFNSNVISVNRTSYYDVHNGMKDGTPKTKGSMRCIKATSDVIDMLKQYKAHQAEERLKVGDKWIDNDKLFTAWNGAPMGPNTARHWFEGFCKDNNLRYVNVHSFRHLNASLLISSGTDVKTVSALLGHSQTSTTLNIYAHTFAQAQAEATQAVADIIKFGKDKQA